jgi:hypothetical protein
MSRRPIGEEDLVDAEVPPEQILRECDGAKQ